MVRDAQPPVIRIQSRHAGTGVPLGSVAVAAYVEDEPNSSVLARALTRQYGFAELEIDADQWQRNIRIRVTDGETTGVPVSHEALDGEVTVVLEVAATEDVHPESFTLLADHLVATRRVRAEDLASDLENPALDSAVRLLSAGDRASLIDRLAQAALRHDDADGETALVDPSSLRHGELTFVPIGDLADRPTHASPTLLTSLNPAWAGNYSRGHCPTTSRTATTCGRCSCCSSTSRSSAWARTQRPSRTSLSRS